MTALDRVLFAFLTVLSMPLLAAGLFVSAEIVVVTGARSAITSLSARQAEQLYLGRVRHLADDTPVSLADLPAGAVRDRFYERLTGKNPAQIRAYWSRMVFTGRALPPDEVAGIDALRARLANDPHLIGYLPAAAAGTDLRVLLRLP